MDQGLMSYIEKRNNRTYKFIHEFDVYGSPVDPYEECKILKYVSKLGPAFPQNVKCEGPYKLSYDFIPGITLKKYIGINYPIPLFPFSYYYSFRLAYTFSLRLTLRPFRLCGISKNQLKIFVAQIRISFTPNCKLTFPLYSFSSIV